MAEQTWTLPDGTLPTTVVARDGRAWLSRLFGMEAGQNGSDCAWPRMSGLATLTVDGERYEGLSLAAEDVAFDESAARFRFRAGETGVLMESAWTVCPETGCILREDVLVNDGDATRRVRRCLARFGFPGMEYDLHAQDSGWCDENRTGRIPLHGGAFVLRSEWGRSTQGATPYMALRPRDGDAGVAMHILPAGNWVIRARPHALAGRARTTVVELGLSDEDLDIPLEPGERLELPGVLLVPLADGRVESGAAPLHRFALRRWFADAKPEAPVVWNSWFDQFDQLELGRLRGQLRAAAEAGVEVLVIDAGWYGSTPDGWGAQVGDWRENPTRAFRGGMADFADEVRAAGLGFGLWMEPERFASEAPVREEHPEWFTEVDDGRNARIDLARPDAYEWLRSEIVRLVETYGLAWMKIDFNFPLGHDASGRELTAYYAAWRRLMDETRRAFPQTFFEGCAGGGLRSDLVALMHQDGMFPSDTVNPVDIIRIREGAVLRLPPGRIAGWAVLRNGGRTAPNYGKTVAESDETILTPVGALWTGYCETDLDFALVTAMAGMFGFSGDFAGLPDAAKARIKEAIAFYKQRRRSIVGAVVHPLTPVRTLDDRTGWSAAQYVDESAGSSLVFAWRLVDEQSVRHFALRDLDPDRTYAVSSPLSDEPAEAVRGADLMERGLAVALPASGTATIRSITPADTE